MMLFYFFFFSVLFFSIILNYTKKYGVCASPQNRTGDLLLFCFLILQDRRSTTELERQLLRGVGFEPTRISPTRLKRVLLTTQASSLYVVISPQYIV